MKILNDQKLGSLLHPIVRSVTDTVRNRDSVILEITPWYYSTWDDVNIITATDIYAKTTPENGKIRFGSSLLSVSQHPSLCSIRTDGTRYRLATGD